MMFGRRAFVASGVALGVANAAHAHVLPPAKRRAIDGIELPPGFNGAIAYGRRGTIEHVRHAGMADVEAGRKVSAETQFKLGSASKWLVSVAVLRLVDQGRIALDAPITAYLPDFRRDTGDRVRIVHLLSNTSGIPDLLTRQIATEPELRSSSAGAAAIVRRFAGGDLSFEPGRGWDYAALNWAILAAILEQRINEPLPQLVDRLVLRPLGMRHTGFAQADQPALPNLAAAYGSVAPPVRKMVSVPPFLGASGNVAATVQDAMGAAHGVFHGALLSAASREALTTVHWPEQEYALGGRIHGIGENRWAWETGKVQGYRTHLAHRLDRSETIVIFNTTDMAQSAIAAWVETVARA